MRRSSLYFLVIASALLNGCVTKNNSPHHMTQVASSFINRQAVVATTPETYPKKNPQTITLYGKNTSPHAAYRVIGVATVSKYNVFGVERQEKIMHEMMKKLAASIGGDGLMDLTRTRDKIKANVIAFQKILI